MFILILSLVSLLAKNYNFSKYVLIIFFDKGYRVRNYLSGLPVLSDLAAVSSRNISLSIYYT